MRYAGYANANQAGARLVMIEDDDGTTIGPLPHIVKHSPDGFSWGYGGSGPADLARSLLIHALDLKSDCPSCGGTGCRYTYPEDRTPCFACDGGFREPRPAMYQDFKAQVIAQLPGDEDWELDRDVVKRWVATWRSNHQAAQDA